MYCSLTVIVPSQLFNAFKRKLKTTEQLFELASGKTLHVH